MNSRLYIYLCEDARMIRQRVFVEEQGFTEEFDDKDGKSLHIVAYSDSGEPIGTGRMFSLGGGVYVIGRIAAVRQWRGMGVGAHMLGRLCGECAKCGAREIQLWAQERAVGFYERSGFEKTEETMTEDGVLHFKMVRYV